MAETARQSSPGPQVNVSNSLVEFSGAESDSLVAPAEYDIHSTDLHTASGVTLDEKQTLLTGSVLDLFLGKATLKKLSLWTDDALFEDPLTIAKGRKQFEAQWYGLAKAFSEIEQLSHNITVAGNPIELDMKTRYKMAGIGKEQVIESKIKVFYEGGKITKVQDRWNDQLPDGAFKNAFRKLNAVSVPTMVGVPKSEEEEAAKSK